MNFPQWLQPPLPQVTGTLREHSYAEEFRLAREEALVLDQVERKKLETAKQLAASMGGIRRAKQQKLRVAADMLRRGETLLQRKTRQNKEAYQRRKARNA